MTLKQLEKEDVIFKNALTHCPLYNEWARTHQDLICLFHIHRAVRKYEAGDLSKRIFTCCSLYEVSGQRMDGVTKLFCLSLHHSVVLLSSWYCAEPLERAQTGQNCSHCAAGQEVIYNLQGFSVLLRKFWKLIKH